MYRLTLKLKLQVIIKHAIDAGFMFKQISCKVLSTIKKKQNGLFKNVISCISNIIL